MALMLPPGVRRSETPGNCWLLSSAAVAMAPLPEPGAPVMYCAGPLFPAEVTTEIPAAAAFVDAIADGLSARPNAEPSDMLITSMSFSTAQSIACTVTWVAPLQPKTRTKYRSACGATPGPISQSSSCVEESYGP